jgi:hypothetical protein
MPDRFYYAYDANRQGPFTREQLRELVEAGRIQPADTIWREGVEKGLPAGQFENLFPADAFESDPAAPPAPAESPNAEATPPVPASAVESASQEPAAQEPAKDAAPTAAPPAAEPIKPAPRPPAPVKKGRVTGCKGAVILSQDGVSVRYRKKCIKCETLENSTNRMPIRSGTTRTTFFCKKCRKLQPVEIQGSI